MKHVNSLGRLIAGLKAGTIGASAITLRIASALLHAAVAEDDLTTLSVLDFGGGVGGHYFSVRAVLPRRIRLRWIICETDIMSSAGQRSFQNEDLSFISQIEAAPARVSVVLASGALQYVEQPWTILQRLRERTKWTIIDRFPLMELERDRLTVQRVPPSIYRGAYPAWFLSQAVWRRYVREQNIVYSWKTEEQHLVNSEEIPLVGFFIRENTE